MKKWLFNNKNTMLLNILFPYCAILCIYIMVAVITYLNAYDIVEDTVVASNTRILNEMKATLDSRIAELDSIAQHVASDPKVNRLASMTNPYKGKHTFDVFSLMNNLYNYKLTNNFIVQYFILFKNNNLVVSPGEVYDLYFFYNNILRIDNNNYNDWYNSIFYKQYNGTCLPSQGINYKEKQYKVIPYLQTISNGNNLKGCIMLLIDENGILKPSTRTDIFEEIDFCILDGNMQIITSTQDMLDEYDFISIKNHMTQDRGTIEGEFNNTNMIVSYAKSSVNDWIYLIFQSKSGLVYKIENIRLLNYTIIILLIIAGIGIAYFSLRKSFVPMKNILNMVDYKGKLITFKDNPYKFVQRGILELINEREFLNKRIKEQIPFMRAAFLDRLLRGEIKDAEEAILLSQHIGMNIKAESYNVILVYLLGYEDISFTNSDTLYQINENKIYLKDRINSIFSNNAYIYDVDENNIALILKYDDPDRFKDYLNSSINELTNYAKEGQEDLYIGIGKIYHDLESLHRSYEEARQVVSFSIKQRNNEIKWYYDLPRESNYFFYPKELELSLLNYVKSANMKRTKNLLAEIYTENYIKRRMSPKIYNVLINQLLSGIIRLFDTCMIDDVALKEKFNDIINKINEFNELDLYQEVVNIYCEFCSYFDKNKKSHNNDLINKIMNYINDNYHKSELSLGLISEKFDLSQVYLSQLFKEQTGNNFSDYLTEIRMDEAKRLLKDTNLSIKEISRRVGYNSSNSFCRVFKKRNNMSATEYRNANTRN